ncbi:hypothetical protein EDC04DRAFT_2614668 [Pisolithus marmoratus]|nr:hypothetical protein EDC04DRAFT_2614668 [Pisolithus marmoratus]
MPVAMMKTPSGTLSLAVKGHNNHEQMEYDDCDNEPSLYDHHSDPQASCVMDELSDEQTNNQPSKHVCHDLAHGSLSLGLDVLATACDYSTPFKLELVAKQENENSSPSVKALVINNMSKAIEIYYAILLTENPFPTSVQEVDWAKKAWTLACHHHNTKLTHDGGILKLIMAWSMHIHRQFKSKAHPIVATSFGFKMSANKGVQSKNCLLVGELKQDSAFIFHVQGSSLDKHTGLYTNPAVQQVVNKVLFKNKSDDAIKWEKEDDYSSMFGSHLASLNEFNQAAGELDLLKKLLEQVYSNGCTHAGITVKNTSDQKKAIPTHVFLNAICDYQMAENTRYS